MALELAQKGFIEYCETHQIEQPLEEIQDWTECAKSIRDGMIERSQSRFRDDELNPKGKVGLLTLTPGKLTLLLVNGTFMILDEVLHSNKAFDLAHNQEVFHDIIPESVYYTTKLNCMALEKGTIKLKFVHNIFFQICIDCALQLILDNHFEKLIPVMNERGFNEEKQQKYINYGNKFLNDLRESYKKSGATIENLQTRYDWNSMLK